MNMGVDHVDFSKGIFIKKDTESNIREFHENLLKFYTNKPYQCHHEPERVESTIPYMQCKKCYSRLYNLEGTIPYREAKGY